MRVALDTRVKLWVNGKVVPIEKWEYYFDPLTREVQVSLKVDPFYVDPETLPVPDLNDVMRQWAKK